MKTTSSRIGSRVTKTLKSPHPCHCLNPRWKQPSSRQSKNFNNWNRTIPISSKIRRKRCRPNLWSCPAHRFPALRGYPLWTFYSSKCRLKAPRKASLSQRLTETTKRRKIKTIISTSQFRRCLESSHPLHTSLCPNSKWSRDGRYTRTPSSSRSTRRRWTRPRSTEKT